MQCMCGQSVITFRYEDHVKGCKKLRILYLMGKVYAGEYLSVKKVLMNNLLLINNDNLKHTCEMIVNKEICDPGCI